MTTAIPKSLEPRERIAIWLIGSGHLVSHFYHMVLPMMFPFIVSDLGVSVTEDTVFCFDGNRSGTYWTAGR